ncbi:hypothetical protein [Curtobacterium sp. 260]|uniref:hypothetical protein n=1 Tax=Curtobacterium sp. 260 TaxID=2817748 RepID=UPI0027862C7E|nr:hypothetical protein [Curtobacterium sp. 260]MDP9736710.1 hypothetical protein [Curtobacterium sp. 260]
MSPLVARCCLVGPAVVLLLVGVVADLPVVARTVLLVAAASCAVLDALTVRGTGADPPPAVVVTMPTDAVSGSAVSGSAVAGSAVAGPAVCGDDALSGAVGASSWTPVPHASGLGVGVRGGGVVEGLVLGRGPDGRAERIRADPGSPSHVVVLGTGAFARAVFDALGVQLAASALDRTAGAAGSADADVRIVSDAGPQSGAPPGVRPTPTGTAVAVRHDALGRVQATVVLVPGVHLLPRRRDRVIEVTRHGCRLWGDGDGVAPSFEPVLPLLAGDSVDALVAG